MKKWLFLIAVSLFTVSCGEKADPVKKPVAKEENTRIVLGGKYRIYSDILDEEREYWVSLPKQYDAGKKYPYVYLLDGSSHFEYVAGTLRKIGGGKIPEFILVGINNTNRTRDLTPTNTLWQPDGSETEQFRDSGGADAFLEYIASELAPAIEAKYPAEPYRMLIGHSFGGIFALNAALEKPDIFNSYIVIDPSLWWDDQELVKRLEARLATPPEISQTIYMSAANNPDQPGDPEGVMIKPQEAYMALLKTWADRGVRSGFKYYEAENHGTVPLPSLYDGLSFIFEGFSLPSWEAAWDMDNMVRHYREWSKRLGYELKPTERYLGRMSNGLIRNRKPAQAVRVGELALGYYPGGSIGQQLLGDAYAAAGEKEMARAAYEKALAAGADKDSITEKLNAL